MRRLVRSVAVVVVLAGLGTGCGGQSAPRQTPSPGVLTAFRQMAVQPRELGRAEALAVRNCMRHHGYDVPLPRATSGSVGNLPLALGAAAALNGYAEALDRSTPGGDPDALHGYQSTLPAAEQAVFARRLDDPAAPRAAFTTPNGWHVTASEGGCAAEARTAVYGSVETWLLLFYLPQDLNNAAANTYSDKFVIVANGRYRSCMTDRGRQVSFPQEAVALAQHAVHPGVAEPSPEELVIATADAECQRSSAVVAVTLDSLERIAAPWIAVNAELVERAGAVVAGSLPRAMAILAGGAG